MDKWCRTAASYSVTDENTTLRMHTRELETLTLQYETVRLQNELLQEQTVRAATRVATLTKQAADAQRRVVATREELTQLRRLVLAEQTALATAAAETLAQLTTAVQRREELLETSIQDEKTARQAIAEKFYELSGRIRVFCRVRPPTRQAAAALLFPKPHSVLVGAKEFAFDHVFGPVSTQQDVFAQVTPLVVSFADGYNACIMAYGQTGTGKTFTMMGDRYADDASESAGVIPRALQHVFATVEGRRMTHDDTLSVSMVEIYNDQILDLLSEDASRAGKGAAVKTENDITARPVTHWSHVDAVLTEGNANRNIAATSMNLESSRSHALVFLHLTSHHRSTRELKRSTLCLVDLAGSERIARSQVEGDRLKETQHINKSLAALGDVVYALQHKAKHTPYRNSKLTYMLREMLSGQSKTLLLLQLSPDELDVEETTCSLNFGARVSQVQMGAVRPSVESGELVRLKDETRSLETRLKVSDEKLAEWKDECRYKSEQLTEARERAKDLERQLCSQSDEVASLHEAMERTNALLSPLSPSTGGHLKTAPVSPTQSVKSTRSTASTASLPATPSSMARLTARKSLGASMRQSPLSANDPVLDSEMRRRSLSTLPTRSSPSTLSARSIRASKEAPPALPSRRPLPSPSAASSSVPPSPASSSRIARPRTSLGASASSTGASTASPSTTTGASGTPRTPLRRAGSLAASGGPSPATTPRAAAPPVSRLEARRPLARSASGVRASGPTSTGPTAGARKPTTSSIPTGPSSSSGRRGARA